MIIDVYLKYNNLFVMGLSKRIHRNFRRTNHVVSLDSTCTHGGMDPSAHAGAKNVHAPYASTNPNAMSSARGCENLTGQHKIN